MVLTFAFLCLAEDSALNIPVTVVPSSQSAVLPYMAVEWTGDAGYGITDQEICKSLSKNGISAVSVNSFRYFLKRRTPEEVSNDCSRLIRHFGDQWNRRKVILIGYSFGADVLPFMYNRLPPVIKKNVSLLVIISPSYKADFHFHIASWFGHTAKDALPIIPELEKVKDTKVLCFYGKRDQNASGPEIEKENLAKVIALDTGHRIGRNGYLIVNEILKLLK